MPHFYYLLCHLDWAKFHISLWMPHFYYFLCQLKLGKISHFIFSFFPISIFFQAIRTMEFNHGIGHENITTIFKITLCFLKSEQALHELLVCLVCLFVSFWLCKPPFCFILICLFTSLLFSL